MTTFRVELDPMRIPAPRADARARDDRFARTLDAVHDGRAPAAPEHHRAGADERTADADEQPVVAAAPQPNEPEPEPPPPDGERAAPPPPGRAPLAAATDAGTAAAEPAAGVPSRSDRGARPNPATPIAEPHLPQATGHAGNPAAAELSAAGLAAGTAAAAPATPTAAGSSATPAVAAPGEARAAAADRARTTTSAVLGYRTVDARAQARFEAARDSVLRQIAIRLQAGEAEASIRLEPKELGLLDLQLRVDDSGTARLYLFAERPEVAAMLGRSLDSLRQSLAAHGVHVAHAEVGDGGGQRRGFAADPPDRFGSAAGDAGADADDDAGTALPRRRLTSHGLDFWA